MIKRFDRSRSPDCAKILKSGCKAEESKLRTAQRLTNLIAVFCIISWRIFRITMLNRSAGAADAGIG
jgi:hypothetical protein